MDLKRALTLHWNGLGVGMMSVFFQREGSRVKMQPCAIYDGFDGPELFRAVEKCVVVV